MIRDQVRILYLLFLCYKPAWECWDESWTSQRSSESDSEKLPEIEFGRVDLAIKGIWQYILFSLITKIIWSAWLHHIRG